MVPHCVLLWLNELTQNRMPIESLIAFWKHHSWNNRHWIGLHWFNDRDVANIICLETVWRNDMDWISNLSWISMCETKVHLLSDFWYNPIPYNFFIQIPYLPYTPLKTNVCISLCACVFNILAVLNWMSCNRSFRLATIRPSYTNRRKWQC